MTICDVRGAIIESLTYIAPDGIEYPLQTSERAVLREEGYGTPPITYITQKGPAQHGVFVNDYLLEPRIIQLLVRHNGSSRNDYWSNRAGIMDALRPNKQTVHSDVIPGVLRKALPDGSLRDIRAFIESGPGFTPTPNGWDEYAFQEVLRFIAHDPVWYDPAIVTVNFGTTATQLVFPITFPITFSSTRDTETVAYAGTWIEYPTFVINGPASSVYILNDTTDEHIRFTYPLAAGRSVTIALSYGTKLVTLDDGTNLLGYVDPESDLASFKLIPGDNDIITNGASSITMTYKNRYWGI